MAPPLPHSTEVFNMTNRATAPTELIPAAWHTAGTPENDVAPAYENAGSLAGISTTIPGKILRTGQAWMECQRSGVGITEADGKGYPAAAALPGATDAQYDAAAEGGAYCYICGMVYKNRMARGINAPPSNVHQVFGAECEHIMPYFLLLNMVGINHPTWNTIKNKWWKKNKTKVQAASGAAGVPYAQANFDGYCRALWEHTYLWSCQPCNRYKSDAPFIDVGIATGLNAPNDTSHRFVIGERKHAEGLHDTNSKDGILVGNLEQHITALLIGTAANCITWRGIYREDVKAECVTFDDTLITPAQKAQITAGAYNTGAVGTVGTPGYIGNDNLNRTWVDETLTYAKGKMKPLVDAWNAWAGTKSPNNTGGTDPDPTFFIHSSITHLISRQFILSRPGFTTVSPLLKLGDMLNSHFTGSGVLNTTSGQTIPHTGLHTGGGGFKRRKNKTGQTGGGYTPLPFWVDEWKAQDTEYMFISEIIALNQTDLWLNESMDKYDGMAIVNGDGSGFTMYEGMLVYLPSIEANEYAFYIASTSDAECKAGGDTNEAATYTSITTRWGIPHSGWKCAGAANFLEKNCGESYVNGDGKKGFAIIKLERVVEGDVIERAVKNFLTFLKDTKETELRFRSLGELDTNGDILSSYLTTSSYGSIDGNDDPVNSPGFNEYGIPNTVTASAFGTVFEPSDLESFPGGNLFIKAAKMKVAQITTAKAFTDLLLQIRKGNRDQAIAAVTTAYENPTITAIAQQYYTDDPNVSNSSPVVAGDISSTLKGAALVRLRSPQMGIPIPTDRQVTLAEYILEQKHKVDIANLILKNESGIINKNESDFLENMSGIQVQFEAEIDSAESAAALNNIPGGLYKNLTNIVMSIDDAAVCGGGPHPAEKVKSTILILANLQDNLLYLDWNEGSIPLEIQTSYLQEAVRLFGGTGVSQYCPLLDIYIMLSHKSDSSFRTTTPHPHRVWASTFQPVWYGVLIELLKRQPVENFIDPKPREYFLSLFYEPSTWVALEALLPSMQALYDNPDTAVVGAVLASYTADPQAAAVTSDPQIASQLRGITSILYFLLNDLMNITYNFLINEDGWISALAAEGADSTLVIQKLKVLSPIYEIISDEDAQALVEKVASGIPGFGDSGKLDFPEVPVAGPFQPNRVPKMRNAELPLDNLGIAQLQSSELISNVITAGGMLGEEGQIQRQTASKLLISIYTKFVGEGGDGEALRAAAAGPVELLKQIIGGGVGPDTAAQLLTSIINKGINMEVGAAMLQTFLPAATQAFGAAGVDDEVSAVKFAAETITILLQRPEVFTDPQMGSLIQHAAQIVTEVTPEQFENILRNGNILTPNQDNAIFQLEGGGAPKCQPCSTNEVYKPPKKKSIRKKKRKTNKKSKKKIIKKSPKYSKRKSIKKKSFKKSSKRKSIKKKSKRKSIRKNKK